MILSHLTPERLHSVTQAIFKGGGGLSREKGGGGVLVSEFHGILLLLPTC